MAYAEVFRGRKIESYADRKDKKYLKTAVTLKKSSAELEYKISQIFGNLEEKGLQVKNSATFFCFF